MQKKNIVQQNTLTDRSKRKFLTGLGTLLGGAAASGLLGGNAISVAIAYTPNPNSTASAGKVLSQAHMIMLRNICAIVIPKTSTLGAAEVDTHGFIDNQLHHCHVKAEQQQAKAILLKIDQVAEKRFKCVFSECKLEQQLTLLTSLEAGNEGFSKEDIGNFKFLKGMIIFGYYTSEVGATQEQAYLPIPGGFKGSVPYNSVGKAWTPLGF